MTETKISDILGVLSAPRKEDAVYYRNRYSNLTIRCNGCDQKALISPRSYYQLIHGTKEYYGWIRTEFNETFCPECAKLIKESVERMKFQITTTQGFSDKQLLMDALKPLKRAGNTFLLDSVSDITREVITELNLPAIVQKGEADVVMLFHHLGEEADHLIADAKGQIHKFISKEEKVLNQFEQHLQNLLHTGELAQTMTLEHHGEPAQAATAELQTGGIEAQSVTQNVSSGEQESAPQEVNGDKEAESAQTETN